MNDPVAFVDNAPNGLHIDPIAPTDGEGEGESELTAQAILDKILAAVGDSGKANYRVAAKDNGGFIVSSLTARQRPYDVNGDGHASPIDALIIINSLKLMLNFTFTM